MGLYIYEFLYRGRAPGSVEKPAWHLILASDMKDELGREPQPGFAMTMEQAKAKGFGLPEIVGAINAEILGEVETLRAERIVKDAEIETLTAEKATLEAERDARANGTG